MNEMNNYSENVFEKIKKINEYGEEYWSARELQEALEYAEWRNFEKVVEKAMESCKNSINGVSDHFVDVNKTIKLPKGAKKTIQKRQTRPV